MSDSKDVKVVRATSLDLGRDYGTGSGSSSRSPVVAHGHPEIVDSSPDRGGQIALAADESEPQKGWRAKLAYFKTRDFWFILALGQILAICITGTNTLTTLLAMEGTSLPAFQTFFNYVLLNIVYTGYTLYKYGFKKWGRMVLKDGWKCTISPPQASSRN
jgi:solute carrier family 35 protein F1/2